MFESLSCGVPFIGTNIAGMPEIINSEDYGLLVKPWDPRELSEKFYMAFKKAGTKLKLLITQRILHGKIQLREQLRLTGPLKRIPINICWNSFVGKYHSFNRNNRFVLNF